MERDAGLAAPDHPRPRRHGRPGRPGPGDVRRAAGRDRPADDDLLRVLGCRTRSACSARCRGSTPDGHGAAAPDTRQPAVPARPSAPAARSPLGARSPPSICLTEEPALTGRPRSRAPRATVRPPLPPATPACSLPSWADYRDVDGSDATLVATEVSRRRETARQPVGRQTGPLLEVRDLVKHFPIRGGGTDPAHGRRGPRGLRRLLRSGGRGDARAGRGVGLREVDHGARRPPAARPDLGVGSLSRAPSSPARAAGSSGRCGSDLQVVFQDPFASLDPRMPVGRDRRRAAADPRALGPRTGPRSASTGSSSWSASSRARQPLPQRVLRRSAPACRHRPGPRARAQAAGARRARLGARRLHPGRGREPAGGPAGPSSAWPTCSSRTTCPWCGTSRDRVAVMYLGKIVEIGDRHEVYETPRAPLHPGAAVGRAGPRPRPRAAAAADRARGDVPSAVAPPSGLPVPDPVLEGPGDLRQRGARAGRPRSGPPRRLPLRRGHPGHPRRVISLGPAASPFSWPGLLRTC